MAENFIVPDTNSREQIYQSIIPQIKSVIELESDLIANFANVSSMLKSALDFFWIGFYRVENKELVLGPFQGELACTRIPFGKGVCGEVAETEKAIIVANVDEYSNHIACSSKTKSEIVIPVFRKENLIAVLDIDSVQFDDFTELDKKYLESICSLFNK